MGSWKMRLFLLLWALLLIHNSDALVRHRYYCPPDFVRLGNGCYLFSSHITSWQNAHFACRDVQAQLVVFENRWEDSTIRSYLTRPEFAPLERWIIRLERTTMALGCNGSTDELCRIW